MREADGLVSITIPFYNSERFLSEAIDSVLSQTYTDWELFLVDDGSTDGSTKIAKGYEARFSDKIHHLEHENHRNRGLTSTRNLGARNSRGEFLAFLDSDDVWLPGKLQAQAAAMNAHPEAGLVFGPSEYWCDWDRNGKTQRENYMPELAPGGRVYYPPFLLTKSYPLGLFGAPCPSSFFLRRSAFEHIGGFVESFNPGTYQVFEDIAFLAKAYLNLTVFVSDSCWDRYRLNPFSMWRAVEGTSREESARRYYFSWLREYLRQNSITDPSIWKAVQREGWMYQFPLPVSVSRILRRIQNRLLS